MTETAGDRRANDLGRLRRLALDGDVEAARAFARALERQGDLAALQRDADALAGLDAALGRHLARRLIDAGAAPELQVAGRAPVAFTVEQWDLTDLDPRSAMRLTKPAAVPLLWDARRARLLACDFAERVTGLYAQHPRIRVAHVALLAATRGHVHGKVSQRELGNTRRATERLAARLAGAASGPQLAARAARDAADPDAAMALYRASQGAVRALPRDQAALENSWQHARALAYLLGEVDERG